MNLTFEAGRLVMTVYAAEQASLKRMREAKPHEFDLDDTLYEMLVELFTNDEFVWLSEGPTGDLTSAPMLGILGDEEDMPSGYAERWVGSGLLSWSSGTVCPILFRWAFMNYALESPQGALADMGRAVWLAGQLLDRGQGIKPTDREHSLIKVW